jgi:predicted metal-dependent hydrolase
LRAPVEALIEQKRLGGYLLEKYPRRHKVQSDKALYAFVMALKNDYMKKSMPLSKVLYDGKLHAISHALGTHTFVSRVQGGKLKAKNEIRIASSFKSMPEAFLQMIVVHELAHFKEKEHNKAFYKLCEHMEPRYHQLEFDTRLYLTHLELFGKLYEDVHK